MLSGQEEEEGINRSPVDGADNGTRYGGARRYIYLFPYEYQTSLNEFEAGRGRRQRMSFLAGYGQRQVQVKLRGERGQVGWLSNTRLQNGQNSL